MAELNDIWKDDEAHLDDEQLLRYLRGEILSGEERHAVELKMASDDFLNDAVEGLQQMPAQAPVKKYVQQLNTGLQQQLEQKKKKKEKRKIKELSLIILTVAIVLILAVIGFVLIRMHGK
jgi:CHASE3 domain sensor protein